MLKKKLVLYLSIFLLMAISAVFICSKIISDASQSSTYSEVQAIPFNKVGLLLGTGKFLKGQRLNPYYTYRLQAAIELIRGGKIRYLVISGDNSREDYDEPSQMRSDLISAGIDSNIIYLDYAGFRTFDSMVRLREIFGQHSVTVISQAFHNERAIYIASKEEISAIGYNARDVSGSAGLRVQVREKLARVKVLLDYLTGMKPKFLGPRVYIPE